MEAEAQARKGRKRPQIQSTDIDMPDERSVDIGIDKPLDDDLIYVAQAGDLTDQRIKAALDEEKKWKAFMEENVTFKIAESEDENAPNPVSCGVNGVPRNYWRGREYTDKRKFLNSITSTVRKVRTVSFKNEDNVDDTRMVTKNVPTYPIEIIDDTPLGRRWFKHQQENG